MNIRNLSKMKRELYILIVIAMAVPSAILAQTANDTIRRTVLVESVYNPVIASSEKRSFLPDEQRPAVQREAVVYADQSYDPGNLARSPLGTATTTLREERLLPAYLRLGYGIRNNVDVLGLYRAALGKNDVLDLGASVTGWSGTIPYKNLLWLNDDTWQSRRYDTDVHIGYNHHGRTRFGVQADMGYYTRNFLVALAQIPHDTDLQNSLHYGGNAFVNTPLGQTPFELGVNGGFHRWQNSSWLGQEQPNAENHAHLDGRLAYRTQRTGRIEAVLTGDYINSDNLPDSLRHLYLGFHPSWTLKGKQTLLTLGVNADVASGNNRRIQLSPNCRLAWTPSAPLRFDIVVDGGQDLHTFRDIYRISPWAAESPLGNTYTYVNAQLHMGFRLAEGLHLGTGGGYRITDGALFASDGTGGALLQTRLFNHDAHVWNIVADASYEWKDLYRLKADFIYYGWQADDAVPALLSYAPQMDVNVALRARIVRGLHADASFRFRQFCETSAGRKDAVADLSLKADYALNRVMSVYLSGKNLLNRHSGFCPVYPAQGIHVIGGVTLKL